jgi:hypothetical protein
MNRTGQFCPSIRVFSWLCGTVQEELLHGCVELLHGCVVEPCRRNSRATWELNVTEPVAGNYYPAVAAAAIADANAALTVQLDRAQASACTVYCELCTVYCVLCSDCARCHR